MAHDLATPPPTVEPPLENHHPLADVAPLAWQAALLGALSWFAAPLLWLLATARARPPAGRWGGAIRCPGVLWAGRTLAIRVPADSGRKAQGHAAGCTRRLRLPWSLGELRWSTGVLAARPPGEAARGARRLDGASDDWQLLYDHAVHAPGVTGIAPVRALVSACPLAEPVRGGPAGEGAEDAEDAEDAEGEDDERQRQRPAEEDTPASPAPPASPASPAPSAPPASPAPPAHVPHRALLRLKHRRVLLAEAVDAASGTAVPGPPLTEFVNARLANFARGAPELPGWPARPATLSLAQALAVARATGHLRAAPPGDGRRLGLRVLLPSFQQLLFLDPDEPVVLGNGGTESPI